MDISTIVAIWVLCSAFNVMVILLIFRLVPNGRSPKNCIRAVKIFGLAGPFGFILFLYGLAVTLIEVFVEHILTVKERK